jgi:hypothetical protein
LLQNFQSQLQYRILSKMTEEIVDAMFPSGADGDTPEFEYGKEYPIGTFYYFTATLDELGNIEVTIGQEGTPNKTVITVPTISADFFSSWPF